MSASKVPYTIKLISVLEPVFRACLRQICFQISLKILFLKYILV